MKAENFSFEFRDRKLKNCYVLKVDLDYKMPLDLLKKFILSKYGSLRILGINVHRVLVYSSKRGLHLFVYISSNKNLSELDLCILQFFVGDDFGRTIINLRRIIGDMDWKKYNKLFSDVVWRRKHKCNCNLHKKYMKGFSHTEFAKLFENARRSYRFSI